MHYGLAYIGCGIVFIGIEGHDVAQSEVERSYASLVSRLLCQFQSHHPTLVLHQLLYLQSVNDATRSQFLIQTAVPLSRKTRVFLVVVSHL